MRKTLLFCAALFVAGCCAGCGYSGTTDSVQREATEEMVAEANRQVGMPGISNFTERKFARMILELRDEEIQTWTYIIDMHGELHFLCESIGYGLPYSVQFTNPEKLVRWGTSEGYTLPQPDPNGLFMPGGLSATWVLASTEDGVKPIYVEPQIMVSPFPMHEIKIEEK